MRNAHFFQKNKLRFQMIAINACVAVLPLLIIGIAGYYVYFDMKKKDALANIDLFVEQSNNRLAEYFERVNELTKVVYYSYLLQENTAGEDWKTSEYVIRYLNTFLPLDPALQGIAVIGPDGRTLSAGKTLPGVMIRHIQANVEAGGSSGRMHVSPQFADEHALLAYRVIKSIDQDNYLNDLFIGVMLIDSGWIEDMLRSAHLSDDVILYLMSRDGTRIASNAHEDDDSEIAAVLERGKDGGIADIRLNGTNYIMKSTSNKVLDWEFIALINTDKLVREARVIPYIILAVSAVMAAVVVMAAFFFNIRLTHPIKRIVDAFDRAAGGDLDAKLFFGYKNELTIIQEHYNRMLSEIKKLTERLLQSQQQLYEAEIEKRHYQYNGLQSQVNSHFLYNVLHSIRGMAMTNSKREAAESIDHLVSYFRYITRPDDYVILQKELEHLERYIAIQRLRFGERLQFQVSAEPAVRPLTILKLILQPLVENALLHGLQNKPGRWIVRISIAMRAERLIIRVLDNGIGLDEERLARLQANLEQKAAPSADMPEAEPAAAGIGQGIGLINIHRRIRLYYGDPYGLQVKSWSGRGTIVTVVLPVSGKEEALV